MKKFLLALIILSGSNLQAQNERDFYGTVIDKDICLKSASAMSDQDVSDLISEILSKSGTKNRYIILNCPRVDNCLATKDSQGRPYILYNPAFLNRVKLLRFTTSSLPTQERDWQSLTILAHELGHHLNNHVINPLPGATMHDMEIEADETAGFLMYLLKATLEQAQSVMYDKNVTEKGTYSHPPRQKRLDTISRGYLQAKNEFGKPEQPPRSANEILNSIRLHVKKDPNDRKENQIAYHYYLEGSPDDLNQISEVRYTRNHNTFPEFQIGNYQTSTDRVSNFDFRGYQWGYINDTFVTVVLNNGSISARVLLTIIYDN